jgi:mono/diheme cytochrome c family protein
MRTKRLFLIAAILISSAGTIFAAMPKDTIRTAIPVDSIKMGNALYVQNCARCHKLKDPGKYTMTKWPGLVNKMQKRAKISDEQKALILSYLATAAKK